MKNGYYLSAYISIDEIGNLYNLISNRHDMAIALWKKEDENITLVRYWELERLSRIKHHDVPFYNEESAKKAISQLLAEENLTFDDIIEIWGCPKLGESSTCKDFYYHSISHLFSSLLIDSDIFYNEKILSLALDLKSDNETDERKQDSYGEYVGCYSNRGEITLFNISSPAILWSICKNELGMQEGSLMALATATECRLKNAVSVDVSGGFEYINFALGYDIFNKIFQSITSDDVIDMDSKFSTEENLISAGMKEINRVTTEMMNNQISALVNRFNIDPTEAYLSISGGFGLNCPTNSHLVRTYNFKGFLGVPCMDDSGEALGIGLYEFYTRMKKFNFKLDHAFYGKSFDDEAILASLKERDFIESISNLNAQTFVEDLKNDIIVWYDSCAEIGPRALGHRSLLGDSRKMETKDRLNQVKQRQFWRPVAPIVLREFVGEWFEDDMDSPFMLHTSIVKEEKKPFVPAILHFDGTARLQTIENRSACSTLYNLIKSFYDSTGVPIICNTSLNDKGEPIINTPNDAIRFAIEKKIKIAYINGKRVEVNIDNHFVSELTGNVELEMVFSKEKRQELIHKKNPYSLTIGELLWRKTFPYDITTENGAKRLKRAVNFLYANKPEMKRLYTMELNETLLKNLDIS